MPNQQSTFFFFAVDAVSPLALALFLGAISNRSRTETGLKVQRRNDDMKRLGSFELEGFTDCPARQGMNSKDAAACDIDPSSRRESRTVSREWTIHTQFCNFWSKLQAVT